MGLYPDNHMPGEIFITMAKQGSTISGMMDAFATAISISLQYGVPLDDLCAKFSHMRFEPSGFTNNRQIPIAKSIMDYIFRYLSVKFIGTGDQPVTNSAPTITAETAASDEEQMEIPFSGPVSAPEPLVGPKVDSFIEGANGAATAIDTAPPPTAKGQLDAPSCSNCGSIMVRSGACYSCTNCGATSGCG